MLISNIDLITFDLDDTLWPCMPTIMAAEQELFDWLAALSPALADEHDIQSLRAQRMALAEQHPHIAHDLTAVRRRALQALTEQYQLPTEVPDQATELFRAARNRVAPYSEVRASLLKLREQFQLVAISNGNAQIEQTPLAGCFHHAFLAEEVGAAKPHPALFEAASAAARVPLERALHVGDDPARDIVPARALGMRTVWVNREQQAWPQALPQADLTVQDLKELEACLKE